MGVASIERRFISLNITAPKIRTVIFLSALILKTFIPLQADESASLRGRVLNVQKQPLGGISVSLLRVEGDDIPTVFEITDDDFHFAGLDPGLYTLRVDKEGFHSFASPAFRLEPSHTFFWEVTLAPAEEERLSRGRPVRLDLFQAQHQTIISSRQINDLPTAHNIWSLIENQDLSATTNRIDVGGLRGNLPALFSARGGGSWTQSVYLLNGMDITDPYMPGLPLAVPDFFSIESTRMSDAAHPAAYATPGGVFNMSTLEGSGQTGGSLSAFYIPHVLQSSNISPALQAEGINESHAFNYGLDGNFRLSGPLGSDRLTFFTSATANDTLRDIAEYARDDRSTLLSGFFSLQYRMRTGSLQLLWTGQKLRSPSFGADRGVPFSATKDRGDFSQIFQAIWKVRIQNRHALKAGFGWTSADRKFDFQQEAQAQHGKDIFLGTPLGTAAFASRESRSTLQFFLEGQSLLPRIFGAWHRFDYGLRAKSSSARTQDDIASNLHLGFFEGDPLQVTLFRPSEEHRESGLNLNAYVQDTVTFTGLFSVYLGLHLESSRARYLADDALLSLEDAGGLGYTRRDALRWIHLSPRAGVIIPMSRDQLSVLKVTYARYYFTLPLQYMTYGNPEATGGLVYEWNDGNSDGMFQPEERGALLRRTGPFYSRIDPELKRPFTDEFMIAYSNAFGRTWSFYLAGFFRTTSDLIKTYNIGVPFSEYDPVYLLDDGDDRIKYSYDDLLLTVYEQRAETLGRDLYLLSNVESGSKATHYFGFDLNLMRKWGRRFTFFLSLTATQAEGMTNPGNTEWENDDGVVGTLFDNPNTLINARGRVRFDRAYTGRLGMTYRAPWEITIGFLIKYYDGQPFTRKIIVSGLNQGPFYIQAHPRGVARYEYNRNFDIHIEKRFILGRRALRIMLDGFNISNLAQATEENEWTGPDYPLRFATEIQSPSVYRIGIAYEF